MTEMASVQQPTIDFRVRKTRSVTKKLLKKKNLNNQTLAAEVLVPLSPSKRKFDNNANIIEHSSPSKRWKDSVSQSPLAKVHRSPSASSKVHCNGEKAKHTKSPNRRNKENRPSSPRIGISSPRKLLFSPSKGEATSEPRLGVSSPHKLLSPLNRSSHRKLVLDHNESNEQSELTCPNELNGFKSPVKSQYLPKKSTPKKKLFCDSELANSPSKQLRVNLERIPFKSPVKCFSSSDKSDEHVVVVNVKEHNGHKLKHRKSTKKKSAVENLISPKEYEQKLNDRNENEEKLKSPNKYLKSPKKSSSGENFSPRKQLHRSPRKSIFRSPAKTDDQVSVLQDRILQDDNVLLSPRKKLLQDNILISPRKRTPVSSLLSPTKSARRSVLKSSSPALKMTPKMLKLIKQDVECYDSAKKLLHTAIPDRILCRESEVKTVTDFINKHVDNHHAGSLYVSGAPGTGKTAVITKLIDDMKFPKSKVKSIFINCMMLKNTHAIYTKVLCDLHEKEISVPSIKLAMKQLEKLLTARGPMVILILDEIDQLDSKSQEILYSMFEWPALPKSRLILIGIANALDLTDRILPRLQAQPKCKPKLLNFAPYSKDQILKIIKDRLSDADDVFDSSAVQFCARKVEAVAGDMRRALDICRRAVERVETDVRTQRILTPTDDSTPNTKRKISIAQVSKVVNDVYSSRAMTSQQQNTSIPLQQKLAICSLLLVMKQSKTKDISVGKLYESYNKVCRKRQVNIVDQSEFMNVATLIEARGIFKIKKSKERRLSKVSLRLDEKEVEHTLQDKLLMTQVLRDGL